MNDIEHQHQKAIMQWAKLTRLSALKHPVRPNAFIADLLFAIPNGGHRNKATAGKLKAEGVKPGVPDLMLALANDAYNGLFIELKRHIEKGKPKPQVSKTQKQVMQDFLSAGFACVVAYGEKQATSYIVKYLNNQLTDEDCRAWQGAKNNR